MPDEHAVLSPSSSERWISCPASVKMSLNIPPRALVDMPWAEEGTAAHGMAEIKLRHVWGMTSKKQYKEGLRLWHAAYERRFDAVEIAENVDKYIAFVEERVRANPRSQVMFEQRLDTGVPQSWGTSDTVVVSPVHVEIIDLKYGKGYRVDAEGNTQLRLYGIGALEGIGDILGDIKTVTVTVFQPRLDHTSSGELPAADLRKWRDSIIPVAEEALGDDAHFGPSEEACRWCPASGRCQAQMEFIFKQDFEREPGVITDDEMADALDQVAMVKQWLSSLEAVALERAYSEGSSIPRYKVVMSGGRRVITDPEAAMKILEDSGYAADRYRATKLLGIGKLEKLVGKDQIDKVLGQFISKTDGRPSLVPEGDKRPVASPTAEAQKEFS